MPINESFSLHSLWTQIVGSWVHTTKFHCHCSSLASTPDKDLDSATFQPSSSLSDDIMQSQFHVGETLLYSSEGRSSYVKVKEIFFDDNNQLTFRVTTTAGDDVFAIKEQLRDPQMPDIAFIPSPVPEMRDSASLLDDSQLEQLANPVKLLPLQEE